MLTLSLKYIFISLSFVPAWPGKGLRREINPERPSSYEGLSEKYPLTDPANVFSLEPFEEPLSQFK